MTLIARSGENSRTKVQNVVANSTASPLGTGGLDPSHDLVMAAQDDEEQLNQVLEEAIEDLLTTGIPFG